MYIALSQYEGLPNAFSSFLKTQNCLRCMEGLEDEGKRGGGGDISYLFRQNL